MWNCVDWWKAPRFESDLSIESSLLHLISDDLSSSLNVLNYLSGVPAGSPSRGGDVVVYVKDINQPSLPTLFLYSVLVSISVFMALSTVFHSINSPDNSPFSHTVLPVLSLLYWSFQFMSIYESLFQP